MKRKTSFSLIEIMIGLTLLGVLMSVLFFWYHSFSIQKIALEKLKAPLKEERYAHQTLSRLFSSVELPFFLTKEGSLLFYNDGGLNQRPEASGIVMNLLYFDANGKRLCLATWPKASLTEEKKEALALKNVVVLDHVVSVHFSFYHPRALEKKVVDPESVGHIHPKGGWQKNWPPSFHTLPAFVRLEIQRESEVKNHKIAYTFDLPATVVMADQ